MRRRLWVPEAPALIRARTRDTLIEQPGVRLAGYFRSVELIHARTGLVTERYEFPNVILDFRLKSLCSGTSNINAYFTYCNVGTGSSTPVASQTGLDAFLAATNANGGFSDVSGWAPDQSYYYTRRTFVFTQAQANGVLTEIGAASSAASEGVQWSRQLIRDANGQPTAITKTPEYELRVVYELRNYPVRGDTTYSGLVNGVTQNITARPLGIGHYCWNLASPLIYDYIPIFAVRTTSLAAETASTFGGVQASSFALLPYVSDTMYRDLSLIWSASAANGGVRTFNFGTGTLVSSNYNSSSYQHELSDPPTKINTQRLDVTVRYSIGRYTP